MRLIQNNLFNNELNALNANALSCCKWPEAVNRALVILNNYAVKSFYTRLNKSSSPKGFFK